MIIDDEDKIRFEHFVWFSLLRHLPENSPHQSSIYFLSFSFLTHSKNTISSSHLVLPPLFFFLLRFKKMPPCSSQQKRMARVGRESIPTKRVIKEPIPFFSIFEEGLKGHTRKRKREPEEQKQ